MAEFSLTADTMRCPTCRATQAWSETCRRCKSDLRLLCEVAQSYVAARRECLVALHSGMVDEAVAWADRCVELSPEADARRLLATCLFARGDFAGACEAAAAVNGDD